MKTRVELEKAMDDHQTNIQLLEEQQHMTLEEHQTRVNIYLMLEKSMLAKVAKECLDRGFYDN